MNEQVDMIRPDLENLPVYELPPGYHLRPYQSGDEKTWTDIHLLSETFDTITPDLFRREFGYDEILLAERQLYVTGPDGRALGTASAWMDEDYHGLPYGRVHWVALVPAAQGRGLGQALLSAVMWRLHELGHVRGHLGTSTGRIPALNMYLKFGFLPDLRTDADRAAWETVRPLLKYQF